MNYTNHSLRSDLQEWKNRLSRATYPQFGNQIKFLFGNLDNNKQLTGLLLEAIIQFTYSEDDLDKILIDLRTGGSLEYDSDIDQAAFCYQFLKYCFAKFKSYDIHKYSTFQKSEGRTMPGIIDEYISPIIYYLHDRLDRSSSIIFLLEKYKKRTEWFSKNELTRVYQSADKSYEQIFEDDLRLFLFDQGIDYPFSTPLSASGRADIIGEIDTEDPLILEIKIYDEAKGYGKNRIKDGFSQIVKYANDYHKDVGYLVIFNMNNVEINFKLSEINRVFPPSYLYNNKMFYFVVINCSDSVSASKTGTLKEVIVTSEELTRE
jgi:hypothetical protein